MRQKTALKKQLDTNTMLYSILRFSILFPFLTQLIVTDVVVSRTIEIDTEDKPAKKYLSDGSVEFASLNSARRLQDSSSGCNPKWYNDKQCDVVNCKAECDWDGGDCHESQCLAYISGKVSPNANSDSRPSTDGSTVSPDANSNSRPTTDGSSSRYTGGNDDDYYYYYDDDYYNDNAHPPTKAPVRPPTKSPVPPTKAPLRPPTKAPVSHVSQQDVVVDKALCASKGGNPQLINDRKCDKANRIPECSFDGNDCPWARCRNAGGKPRLINDGTCDKFNNIAECNFDGTDCQSDTSAKTSDKAGNGKALCRNAGGKPHFINDGTCDKFNDIPECNYDGKDCQFKLPSKNSDPYPPSQNDSNTRCSNAGGKPQYINDGTCDEFNDIPECNFDGKDCQFKFPSKNSDPQPSPEQDTNSSGSDSGGDIGLYWTNLHNDVRRHYQEKYGYNYVNVVWSDHLAQSSKSYADVLASNPCDQYDHDPNNPYGENLAVMWEGNDSANEKTRIKRVMDAWTYDEEIKPPTLPYQEGSGHWTQVIWRATKYIGCGHAYRTSEGCHVYVCRYITPGNCARSNDNWLADTMQETTRCEPQCPPTEGCFWKQTS